MMVTEIHRRLETAGETVSRTDGFFDEETNGDRSDAAEVAESVLLKAQREPEEKKIDYMGYLFASIGLQSGNQRTNGTPTHKDRRTTYLPSTMHSKALKS